MRALGTLLMLAAAVVGGVVAWSALDVALGGPGAVARGLVPVPHLHPSAPAFRASSPPSVSPPTTGEPWDRKAARWIRRALVYEANGWLALFYFLSANIAAAAVAAIASAAGWMERRQPWAWRAFTGVVLAISVLTALLVPPPIPMILAVMWAFVPAVMALDPIGGRGLAWRAKSGILLYALAAIGYMAYSRLTAEIPPEAWAAMVGGVEESRAVLAQGRAYTATMAHIALWFVLPLGFLSLMLQAILAHPLPSAPFRTMADWVRLIRTRGTE